MKLGDVKCGMERDHKHS